MAEFELKALITGVDRLSPALTSMQKNLRKFKKQASDAGAGGLAMAGGLAAGLTVSLKAFADQEEAATGLKVALMQSNGEVDSSFENINKLAVGLGNQLPGTTADFQNMMQMLVRQGIPAQNILSGVGKATAYLAVQLKKAPADAAEFAAKMQDATGTASKDMMGLFDTIQKAFYLGVDDTNMLGFFTKTSAVLKMVNQDGLTAAKSLAPISVMMDQMGMQGESAGNALRKVMQAGLNAKKVKAVNKTLAHQKLGFQLDFTDGKGSFGGLDNMFKQLSKLRKLSDVKRTGLLTALFGDDAETLQVVNALIDKGKEGYDQVQQKMDKQASLNKRVEMQLNTLKNLWEALTGTAINGLAAIGGVFSDDAKKLVTWLGDVTEKFAKFTQNNPRLVRGIVGAAAGFIALKLSFLGVGSALGLMNGMLKISPMGAFLRLAALGIGYVIANWDKFGPVIQKLFDEIQRLTEGTDGWKMALAGIAAFIAGKWLTSILDSIRKVGTQAEITGKKMGALGQLGTAAMLYAPVEQTMEATIGKTSAADWMKNHGLFFASDWTPFFSQQSLGEYEKSIKQTGGPQAHSSDARSGINNSDLMPSLNKNIDSGAQSSPDWQKNTWTITPQAKSQPAATVTVDFKNAPAGMRVTDTQAHNIDVNHDVGYSPFRDR